MPRRSSREGAKRATQGERAAAVVVPFPGKELTQLWPDGPYWMDKKQCEVWRPRDGTYQLFGPGGAPAVVRCVCPKGRPPREDQAPTEVMYLIEWRWPNGSKTDAEWYSAAAIRKGECLDRVGVAITGRGEIDLWAKIILAQRRAFDVPIEYPSRRSGFAGADEPPAYVLHDGRILRPHGIVKAGSIADEPPLLQRKRQERWDERFKALPTEPPSEERLRATVEFLLKFDPKARALCAAPLGVGALTYSLRPIERFVYLSGWGGTAKSTIAQIMHWGEGPCAAADEPDVSFRTTFFGGELSLDRAHDCAFLIDDGKRTRPEPGAPLEPAFIQLVSDLGRASFDSAAIRGRGDRLHKLAHQRHVQQLLVFAAETAIGLERTLLARSIWWAFEEGEIERAPMLDPSGLETPAWIFCQETFTAIGHALIRRILDVWALKGRPAAINFLREMYREAAELVATAELGGTDEDRPRVQGSLTAIVASGIMCDAVTGTGTMMRDLMFHYGTQLAQAQLERHTSGSMATAGFGFEFFQAGFEEWINSGDSVWLDGETGKFFESNKPIDSHLIGHGYQWRGERDGWVPASRSRAGWRHDSKKLYWIDPGQFFAYFERRATRQGNIFPFNRQTLPAHLWKIGFTAKGRGGNRNLHKPYIPHSDPRYSTKGSQPRVLCVPFTHLENSKNKRGERGERGEQALSNYNTNNIRLPALPPNVSPLVEERGDFSKQAGRRIIQEQQQLTPISPRSPRSPRLKEPIIEFSPKTGERIENIGGTANPDGVFSEKVAQDTDNIKRKRDFAADPIAAVHAELGVVVTERRDRPVAVALEPVREGRADRPGADSLSEKGRSMASAAALPAIPAARVAQRLAVVDVSAVHIIDDVSKAPRTIAGGPAGWRDLLPFAQLSGITLLWVTPQWCEVAGLPPKLAGPPNDHKWKPYKGMAHPLGDDLAEGWRPNLAPGCLYPYAGFVNDAGLEIEIAIPGFGLGMPALASAPALMLADALRLFRETTRFWLRAHLNAMPNIMLRGMHSGPGTLDLRASLPAADCPAPMRKANLVVDAPHLRVLTADEIAVALWIHGYDANRQYGTAMASLALGFGVPEHITGNIRFDRSRAGYWRARVSRPRGMADGLPHPCKMEPGHRPETEFRWYVTPTLDLAEQFDAGIEITEAHLFPQTHQPLQPLYQRLNQAAAALMAAAGDPAPKVKDAPTVTEYVPGSAKLALALIKQIPRSGIGNFDARTRRGATTPYDLYRPDWRHFVIAKARANLLRAVHRASLVPIAIETDSFYIVSPHADPVMAAGGLKLDPQGGHFKVKWSAPIAALPRGFRGKRTPSMADLRALKAAGKEVD